MQLAVWLRIGALATLGLLAPMAASAEVLSVDIDGDGRLEQIVTADAHEVLVMLSGRVTERLHTRASLVHVVAMDLDRDGHLDIVASTGSGLRVWINNRAGGFSKQKPPRPRRRAAAAWVPRLSMPRADEAGVEVVQISAELVVEESSFQYQPGGQPVRPRARGCLTPRVDVPSGSLRGPPSALLA